MLSVLCLPLRTSETKILQIRSLYSGRLFQVRLRFLQSSNNLDISRFNMSVPLTVNLYDILGYIAQNNRANPKSFSYILVVNSLAQQRRGVRL